MSEWEFCWWTSETIQRIRRLLRKPQLMKLWTSKLQIKSDVRQIRSNLQNRCYQEFRHARRWGRRWGTVATVTRNAVGIWPKRPTNDVTNLRLKYFCQRSKRHFTTVSSIKLLNSVNKFKSGRTGVSHQNTVFNQQTLSFSLFIRAAWMVGFQKI